MRWSNPIHPDPDDAHPAGRDLDHPEPPIPDELVDEVLDGDPQNPLPAALFAALRRSPGAQRDLDAAERALDALRLTPEPASSPTPDLSLRILAEVDRRRGLFSRRGLRCVWLARAAAAAALALAAAALYTLQSRAPDLVSVTPSPTPISGVVTAMPGNPTEALGSMRLAVDSLREAVARPVAETAPSAAWSAWRTPLYRAASEAHALASPATLPRGTASVSPESIWLDILDRQSSTPARSIRSAAYTRETYRAGQGFGVVRNAAYTGRLIDSEEPAPQRGVVFADR